MAGGGFDVWLPKKDTGDGHAFRLMFVHVRPIIVCLAEEFVPLLVHNWHRGSTYDDSDRKGVV